MTGFNYESHYILEFVEKSSSKIVMNFRICYFCNCVMFIFKRQLFSIPYHVDGKIKWEGSKQLESGSAFLHIGNGFGHKATREGHKAPHYLSILFFFLPFIINHICISSQKNTRFIPCLRSKYLFRKKIMIFFEIILLLVKRDK